MNTEKSTTAMMNLFDVRHCRPHGLVLSSMSESKLYFATNLEHSADDETDGRV